MDKSLFYSLITNLLFIFGMIGYLFMDILDYKHSNLFDLFSTNLIYILLAAIFVISSTLQFFVIYYLSKSTQRSYILIFSCIFDKIGSDAYLLGAIFTAILSTKTATISTLTSFGVSAFVVGAVFNLMIPNMNKLSICADYFNLFGSLFYLFASMMTQISLGQMIIILGDVIYFLSSIVYLICWFEDRRRISSQQDQYDLFQ